MARPKNELFNSVSDTSLLTIPLIDYLCQKNNRNYCSPYHDSRWWVVTGDNYDHCALLSVLSTSV